VATGILWVPPFTPGCALMAVSNPGCRSWAGIEEQRAERRARCACGYWRRNMAEPTYEELKAELEELKKSAGRKRGDLEFRVSDKGGVSVYGLGRFPVTLYYEQWVRLLESGERLREFLEENKPKLKLKS